MRTPMALIVLAVMLASGDIAMAQRPSAIDPNLFTAPANPLHLKVEIDPKRMANALIGPDGGRLSLTTAGGTRYELDIPKKALRAPTIITMRGMRKVSGWPDMMTNVGGIEFEPSGLLFSRRATLTVTPKRIDPKFVPIMYGSDAGGFDAYLTPFTRAGGSYRLPIWHFSAIGDGVSDRTMMDQFFISIEKIRAANIE